MLCAGRHFPKRITQLPSSHSSPVDLPCPATPILPTPRYLVPCPSHPCLEVPGWFCFGVDSAQSGEHTTSIAISKAKLMQSSCKALLPSAIHVDETQSGTKEADVGAPRLAVRSTVHSRKLKNAAQGCGSRSVLPAGKYTLTLQVKQEPLAAVSPRTALYISPYSARVVA